MSIFKNLFSKNTRSENDNSGTTVELTHIDKLAQKAVTLSRTNPGRDEIQALIDLYTAVNKSSSQLMRAKDYKSLGLAFNIMSIYRNPFLQTEELRREIADNIFYCLSKAIAQKDEEMLRMNRLMMLAKFHEEFHYTIANALDIPSPNPFDFSLSGSMPLIVRTNEYLYDMAYLDLQHYSKTIFDEGVIELKKNVDRQFRHDANRGQETIDKILAYLDSVYAQY